MPSAPAPDAECKPSKSLVCGPAEPLALRLALGRYTKTLRSDRVRRGLALPSLRRLFGRAGVRAVGSVKGGGHACAGARRRRRPDRLQGSDLRPRRVADPLDPLHRYGRRLPGRRARQRHRRQGPRQPARRRAHRDRGAQRPLRAHDRLHDRHRRQHGDLGASSTATRSSRTSSRTRSPPPMPASAGSAAVPNPASSDAQAHWLVMVRDRATPATRSATSRCTTTSPTRSPSSARRYHRELFRRGSSVGRAHD